MVMRKIDLMHQQFGKTDGKFCKDCFNLAIHQWGTRYHKCLVYGVSNSEATDWKMKYPACGMFNKEWNGNDIVRLVSRSADENEPIKGQIGMFE